MTKGIPSSVFSTLSSNTQDNFIAAFAYSVTLSDGMLVFIWPEPQVAPLDDTLQHVYRPCDKLSVCTVL